MIQLCRRILRNNCRCGQPAINGTRYCRHHRDVTDWKRSSGLRSQIATQTYDHGTMLVPDREPNPPYPIDLEFPEDPAAILTNIYRVTSLLLQGQIDRPTANSVTYGMQVCLSALNGKSLFEPSATAPTNSQSRSASDLDDTDSESASYSDPSTPATPLSRPIHRVILTPDGDEIAPPVEILEDNEAQPIHHRGCPCRLCAEKYRNQPPELHHADCACGLCEEGTEIREQGSELPSDCHPERSAEGAESKDLLLADSSTIKGAPSLAEPKVGIDDLSTTTSILDPCSLIPKPRIARAAALLSGSVSRDPLNRPWSVAEYTFGDAIRRHEAQYAARAAACLAVGIEPPPYEPFATGLIPAGTPEYEEDQRMQQHSSEYWAAHFRKQIAERPDGPSPEERKYYLEEEPADTKSGPPKIGD
jgi:hypothetical protein